MRFWPDAVNTMNKLQFVIFISVINWRLSSVELNWQQLRRSTCFGGIFRSPEFATKLRQMKADYRRYRGNLGHLPRPLGYMPPYLITDFNPNINFVLNKYVGPPYSRTEMLHAACMLPGINSCRSVSVVVWPTTSCFADWLKRRHVTLRIIIRQEGVEYLQHVTS